MTPAAIREGFGKLRSDEAMLPLADAAVCRSESDWLVGINGTRAMTAFNSKSGGFQRRPSAACKRRRWRSWSNAKRKLHVRPARLLGSHRHLRRRGGRIYRPLVR